MSEVLESARTMIETRIAEIDAEVKSLRSALASLGSGSASAPARTKPPAKRRTPRRSKRAPRGQRREQVLAAVAKSPGASAADIGREVGISTNQAYGLVQRLLKEKAIKKQGKGYKPS